jgi:GT2 family glycosyltransferase
VTIGIGITTFNRPEYLERCAKAMKRHLYTNGVPCFWKLAVYNDGSDAAKHHGAYERAYKPVRAMGGRVIEGTVNRGCAVAKNALITHLLADPNIEWIILAEDDIIVQSPEAVTEYVRIAQESGVRHLSFAHHGPANAGGKIADKGEVEYYYHSIGAWCLFHRDDLMTHGLLDENFVRAWEHVEHELRLGVQPHMFPDIAGSDRYLAEIPGSIERSSIRPMPDWSDNIRNGLIYWRDNRPETFKAMFGDGCPLQGYANSILG